MKTDLNFYPSLANPNLWRQKTKLVTEFVLNKGLLQVCGRQNKSNNISDLIFTNMPELTYVQKSYMPLIPESIQDDAHILMSCYVEYEPKRFNAKMDDRKKYCFKKCNYDAINEFLGTINFAEMLAVHDLNQAVGAFYTTIYKFFYEFIPTASLRVNNKPPWFDKELTSLKNSRIKEFKKLSNMKQLNRDADDSQFIIARDRFNDCQSSKYDEYVKQMLANSTDKMQNNSGNS